MSKRSIYLMLLVVVLPFMVLANSNTYFILYRTKLDQNEITLKLKDKNIAKKLGFKVLDTFPKISANLVSSVSGPACSRIEKNRYRLCLPNRNFTARFFSEQGKKLDGSGFASESSASDRAIDFSQKKKGKCFAFIHAEPFFELQPSNGGSSPPSGFFAIGHDLVHERATQYKGSDLTPTTVGIIDAGLNEECIDGSPHNATEARKICTAEQTNTHGVRVSSVIFSRKSGSAFSDRAPFKRSQFDFSAVIKQGSNNQVTHVDQSRATFERELSEAARAVEKLLQENSRVINFSGYFGVDGNAPEAIETNNGIIAIMRKLLDDPKRVLVQAASYSDLLQRIKEPTRTEMIEEQGRVVRETGAIIVGSIAKDGHPDVTHNDRDSITIFAPTGNFGSVEGFGNLPAAITATSGATPLVSLAIADVVTLMPALNREQIKQLMQKTAIPTPYGAGMLNSYKMFRAAERIKQNCSSVPEVSQCIDVMLNSPQIFDFTSESKSLQESIKYDVKSPLCPEKAEWQKARKAYLLNPTYETLQAFKSWPLGFDYYPTQNQEFRLSGHPAYVNESALEKGAK